jgi:hypothetical protein
MLGDHSEQIKNNMAGARPPIGRDLARPVRAIWLLFDRCPWLLAATLRGQKSVT